MDPEGSMLSEISQTETEKCLTNDLTNMWNLKNKCIEKEIRLVVTRGRRWREGELEEGDEELQTSSYKIRKY